VRLCRSEIFFDERRAKNLREKLFFLQTEKTKEKKQKIVEDEKIANLQ
jgi:hypothetical protein